MLNKKVCTLTAGFLICFMMLMPFTAIAHEMPERQQPDMVSKTGLTSDMTVQNVVYDNEYQFVNASFEEELTADEQIPGWNPRITHPDSHLEKFAGLSNSGDHSLFFYDNNQESSLRVESDQTPIDGGNVYVASIEAYKIYQSNRIVIDLAFFTADGREVSSVTELFGDDELPVEEWTTLQVMSAAPEDAEYASLTFHSGGISITEVYFDDAHIYPINFDDLALNIEVEGVFEGQPSTIIVTDELGNRVEGATVSEVNLDIDFGMSDENGEIQTDELTIQGSEVHLQANLEGRISDVFIFQIYGELGDELPENLVLTWQQDPKKTASFTWRTSPDIDETKVELLLESEYNGSFDHEDTIRIQGSSFLFQTDIGEMRVHEAEAVGLESGTRYAYRVGSGEENGWSDPAFFTTEAEGEEPFTFLFTSDTQAGPNSFDYSIWGEIFDKAAIHHADATFMLLSGDIVDYGDQQLHWENWFKEAEVHLANMFMVPVIGNHDNIGSGVENFKAQFQLPRNGPSGEIEHAYSFDYSNMHIAILNSEGDIEEQADWLREDMNQTDKDWKIVSMHRSPYPSHQNRDSKFIRDGWVPVFDDVGIDLVLSGHDHAYMRSWPLRDGEIVPEEEGITYIIGGSAGPKLYPVGDHPYMRVSHFGTQIYSAVSIDGNELTMEVTTREGETVDLFTMVKSDLSYADLELEGPESVQPGTAFDVDMKLDNLTDYSDVSMEFSYDPKKVRAFNVLVNEQVTGQVTENEIQPEEGKISFAMSKLDVSETDNFERLATIQFEVLDNAEGEVMVEWVEGRASLKDRDDSEVLLQSSTYSTSISGFLVTGKIILPEAHHLEDLSGFIVRLVNDGEPIAMTESQEDGTFRIGYEGTPGVHELIIERESYLTTSGSIQIYQTDDTLNVGDVMMLVGDYDSDGLINIVDIQMISKVFLQEPSDDFSVYDVDQSGTIDLKDVVTIARNFHKTAEGIEWPDVPSPPVSPFTNASFEEGLDEVGEIPGWAITDMAEGSVLERSNRYAYTGNYSLYFHDAREDNGLRIESETAPLESGKTYTLTVEAYVIEQSHSIVLDLEYYNEDQQSLEIVPHLFKNLPTEEWTTLSIEFEAPAEAEYVGLNLHSGGVSITEAYFDDVYFHEKK